MLAQRNRVSAVNVGPAEGVAGSATGVEAGKPKTERGRERKASRNRTALTENASLTAELPSMDLITPADAEGSESIRQAGNREMLLFAQNEAALLRRQEALFRKASAWIANVPEARREGVRQAVMVYARNVRAWQTQAREQESAFLAARDRDQQARARFMLAEKSLTDAAQKKRFGFMGWAFRGRRAQALESVSQAAEHAAAVREALHDQGLAIHRYMRFHSEWRQSLEEMMAFVAEQSD